MSFILRYKFTFVLTFIILYALFMPSSQVPSVSIEGLDKLVHFFMFFTLISCYYFEFIAYHEHLPSFLKVFLLGGCFGLFTELIQGFFTASRAFDWMDLVADSIGVVLGGLFMCFVFTYLKNYLNFFYRLLYKKEITS